MEHKLKEFLAARRRKIPRAASRIQSEDGGGRNDRQGNDSENAYSHSPDNHSLDFGFFAQNYRIL
jgi:hypothetical protein